MKFNFFKEILSKEEVKTIKEHTYKTTGYSWLDYKLNPYWEFMAKKLPYKLTPNKVTVLGAFSLYIGVIILSFYDLTFTKIVPDWLYSLFGISIFLGQTLDAIDGKHARNTKRGSPLGQLMDHGCDSITNSCVAIYTAQACIAGASRINIILMQGIVQTAFYVATWEENRTGIIRTHMNNIGVTEIQMVTILFCLTPIYEKGFALITFNFISNFSIIDFIIYIVSLLILYIVLKCLMNVYRSENKSSYINATKPFFSLIILIISQCLISQFNNYRQYLLLFVAMNGFYFSLSASKMIITTMSKKTLEIPTLESIVLFFGVIIGLVFTNYQVYIMIFLFTFIILYYLWYFGSVINQLMKELDIKYF